MKCRVEVAKVATESLMTHQQQCLHPTVQLMVPPLCSKTYQDGSDDKRPISQGICDVG